MNPVFTFLIPFVSFVLYTAVFSPAAPCRSVDSLESMFLSPPARGDKTGGKTYTALVADYGKSDFWAQKARQEGYPARSVYKLKEICEKFSLLPRNLSGFRALDLGAAPGSWSLYLLRALRPRAGGLRPRAGERTAPFLAAADLSPLSRAFDQGLFSGENFFFLQGDFTLPENRETLLARGPYHLIVSDAAPATTGNRQIDTLRSLALAEEALAYAETALVPGGSLVVKVFQGGGTAELLSRIRAIFKTGRSFKPHACRGESFETYYLGLEKRLPAPA